MSRVRRDFWIQKLRLFPDFFPKQFISFKTQGYQIGDIDVEKRRNKAFAWCAANIPARLNKILPKGKEFTSKTLVVTLKKNSRLYHFSRLYLYFSDFFQVWKVAGQISRLFQEFKTLYEPCVSFLLWILSFKLVFLA